MTFLFSPYTWLLLAGLPVLIHLINLLRHRRVKWAAMDFLLQSQKRNKKWIVFKQLLLLLLRVAAIAAIVFMVAQPKLRSDWSKLFGSSTVHHIVLLDDSYSMSDRRGNETAFDRAKRATLEIAKLASDQPGQQAFSLIRFSGQPTLSLQAENTIGEEFNVTLKTALDPLTATETAALPSTALEAMSRLPSKASDENRIVYLVSDFRAAQWENSTELRKQLDEISARGTRLHLVHCVDAARPNLTIAELQPTIGTRAAGVELFMEVAVKNQGEETATNVALKVEENGNPRPGLRIDEIAPGDTAVRRFRVNFQSAGEHTVAAKIEQADAVEVDNTRYDVIEIEDAVPVLLIDGDAATHDAKRLADALSPGGTVQTGLRPRIERPQFLRQPEQLAEFATIFLLNVPHLDATEIETLENFVRAGGGLGIFLGETVDGRFYTEDLYKAGEGLFPCPIVRSTDLLAASEPNTPDMQTSDHPLFKMFRELRRNPLDDVRIERYFDIPGDWQPEKASTVQVIAKLRNGAPLIVEQRFGAGRVVAVLTKASTFKTSEFGSWNNWAKTYSYLPTMVLLQSYLEAGRQRNDVRLVGQPIELTLPAAEYGDTAEFVPPQNSAEGPLTVKATKTDQQLKFNFTDTNRSGFYNIALQSATGHKSNRRYAYNVSPGEGDLHTLDGPQLASRFEGLKYEFHRAEDLSYSPESLAGVDLGDKLFYALVALLLAEQAMAYATSFHPPRRRATA